MAQLRQLEMLRIELAEVAGGSALPSRSGCGDPTAEASASAGGGPAASFAFPFWPEWTQLPASLEALSGNLPLRLEALPPGGCSGSKSPARYASPLAAAGSAQCGLVWCLSKEEERGS